MPAAWREPSGPGKGLGGLAAFKAPALVAGLDDVAMVSEPVEQRCRHLGVTEHRWPFAEREVGSDDDRGLLVKSADQVEQQLATRQRERQITELVQDHEIEPVGMTGAAWPAAKNRLAPPGITIAMTRSRPAQLDGPRRLQWAQRGSIMVEPMV